MRERPFCNIGKRYRRPPPLFATGHGVRPVDGAINLNGSFPKLGVPFWGPYNKDYSILGSILGSSYLGKLPNQNSSHPWTDGA